MSAFTFHKLKGLFVILDGDKGSALNTALFCRQADDVALDGVIDARYGIGSVACEKLVQVLYENVVSAAVTELVSLRRIINVLDLFDSLTEVCELDLVIFKI